MGQAESHEVNAPTAQEETDDTCPVCLETFTDPLVLQCGHVFCYTCLEKWLDKVKLSLVCPVCADHFLFASADKLRDLPPPASIADSREEIAKFLAAANSTTAKKTRRCEFCSKKAGVPASSFCHTCGRNMCGPCSGKHQLTAFTKTHETSLLTSRTTCRVHGGEFVVGLCHTCHVPVCIFCIQTEHANHHVLDVTDQDLVNDRIKIIRQTTNSAEKQLKSLQLHLEKARRAEREVTGAFNDTTQKVVKIRDRMNKQFDELLDELSRQQVAEESKMKTHTDEVKQLTDDLSGMVALLSDVKTSRDARSIVLTTQDIPRVSAASVPSLPHCVKPRMVSSEDHLGDIIPALISYQTCRGTPGQDAPTPQRQWEVQTHPSSRVVAFDDVMADWVGQTLHSSDPGFWGLERVSESPSQSPHTSGSTSDIVTARADPGQSPHTSGSTSDVASTLTWDSKRRQFIVLADSEPRLHCYSRALQLVRTLDVSRDLDDVTVTDAVYCKRKDQIVLLQDDNKLQSISAETGQAARSTDIKLPEEVSSRTLQSLYHRCHDSGCRFAAWTDYEEQLIVVLDTGGNCLRSVDKFGSGEGDIGKVCSVLLDEQDNVLVSDVYHGQLVRLGESEAEGHHVLLDQDDLGGGFPYGICFSDADDSFLMEVVRKSQCCYKYK